MVVHGSIPSAFAPVTTANFGNRQLQLVYAGPGQRSLIPASSAIFKIWERLSMQFRAESFNVPPTHPHFNNPGARMHFECVHRKPMASITALNGYSQITTLNPLGRLLDARYFRFGVRFTF